MKVIVRVEIDGKLVSYYEHELAGSHAPEVAGKIHELVKKYGTRKRPKRILTPEEFKEAYENKELIENYGVRKQPFTVDYGACEDGNCEHKLPKKDKH